jgi:uncharacterized cupredoxin-like copper-binding protein
MIKTIAVAIAVALAGSALAHEGAKQQKKADAPISTEENAFGREGDPKRVSRTIDVEMSDKMRFTPDALAVKQGETIRFRVRNSGQVMHEMVLGTMEGLQEHAELMRKNPGMEHGDPYMAHVAPGKTETMVWQFTKPGDFLYGCLVSGHFEAGMVGHVRVADLNQKNESQTQSSAQAFALAEGEVRKVDKDAQKITLRHGPLPDLDMPKPMTMVYRVKDPAMLDRVKAGDKVKFEAEKIAGAFTVTKIEPVK